MKLPDSDKLRISRRKVTGYLLAAGHPVGGPKARYFMSRGFRLEKPGELETVLSRIAQEGRVVEQEATRWGMTYVVEGSATAPDGNLVALRVVWIVKEGEVPELVTAYPS